MEVQEQQQQIPKKIPKRVGADTNIRVNYKNYITHYLNGLNSEIQTEEGKQCLNALGLDSTSHGTKLMLGKKIRVAKQIGTKSANGLAFLVTGRSKEIVMAMKIMANHSYNLPEIKYLETFSKMLEEGVSPNLPLCYKVISCTLPCKDRKKLTSLSIMDQFVTTCPIITHKPYFLILNELADGDLKMWLTSTHTPMEMYNVIQQTLLSVAVMHSIGVSHCDAHYGNFLFHRISPGGYWWYKLNGKDYYVKNVGVLFTSWDYGFTTEHGNECSPDVVASPATDVERLLYTIINGSLKNGNVSKDVIENVTKLKAISQS